MDILLSLKHLHLKLLPGCKIENSLFRCNIKKKFPNIENLEKLTLEDCDEHKLEIFLNTCLSLKSLNLEGCNNLSIRIDKIYTKTLKELNLTGCKNIYSILNNPEQLPGLERLNLTGCVNIRSDILSVLPTTLKVLNLTGCPWIVKNSILPNKNKVWERFENLEVLYLDNCNIQFQCSMDNSELLNALALCKGLKKISLKHINFGTENIKKIEYLKSTFRVCFKFGHAQFETILW
jgi:hypothetical protein